MESVPNRPNIRPEHRRYGIYVIGSRACIDANRRLCWVCSLVRHDEIFRVTAKSNQRYCGPLIGTKDVRKLFLDEKDSSFLRQVDTNINYARTMLCESRWKYPLQKMSQISVLHKTEVDFRTHELADVRVRSTGWSIIEPKHYTSFVNFPPEWHVSCINQARLSLYIYKLPRKSSDAKPTDFCFSHFLCLPCSRLLEFPTIEQDG